MKLKDWVEDERPREKMLRSGASALSNAELIAILLRTGTQGVNVLEVSQELLKVVGGSLTKASQMTISQLCKIDGIGPGKALGLVAALELGKRLVAEAPPLQKEQILSAEDVYRMMLPKMRGLQHEECWAFFLNRINRILEKTLISSGTLNDTPIDVKTIVYKAMDLHATNVILVHNHPSGDPYPGNADVNITLKLRKALKTFDMSLIDHIIIADGLYYSFTDDGTTKMKEE